MNNFAYYIFCGIVIIVAILAIKKVAGCLFRVVLLAIAAAVLAAVYYYSLK